MNSDIKKTWHGLTGAQVREIIKKTEQTAENAINIVNTVVQANDEGKLQISPDYLPSYVDDVIEGVLIADDKENFNVLQEDGSYKATSAEKSKIYIDIDSNKSYRWAAQSGFTEIASGDEIQRRLNNFNGQEETSIETVVNNKVDKADGYRLSKNDYTDAEKNKISIVTKLPGPGEDKSNIYYLTNPSLGNDPGLYYYRVNKWQRVGGLL